MGETQRGSQERKRKLEVEEDTEGGSMRERDRQVE